MVVEILDLNALGALFGSCSRDGATKKKKKKQKKKKKKKKKRLVMTDDL